MAVIRGAAILHEDVGVRFEERDQLLGGGDGLAVEHAARGLVDHLRDAREQRGEMPAHAVPRGRRGQTLEVRQRAGGVSGHRLRELEELAVARAAPGGPLRREMRNLHCAPLRAMEVPVIRGEPRPRLGLPQRALEHPDGIEQETRIGRRMNGHGHHGGIHAHGAGELDRPRGGARHELVVQCGERVRRDTPQRRGEC